MRIVIIGMNPIPSTRANSIQTMKMAQAFAELEHEVMVISPIYNQESASTQVNWSSISSHYGVNTEFELHFIPTINLYRKYDYAFKAVRKANNWNADIVYTRLFPAGTLSSYFFKNTVFELHELPPKQMGKFLFDRFISSSKKKSIVYITDALRAATIREHPRAAKIQSTIQPDGVDLGRYINIPDAAIARGKLRNFNENLKMLQERFTLGYTGHLYRGRGVDLLLEIASIFPEFNFLIVGGVPSDVARVKDEVKRKNLKNVLLTGFVPNANLPIYQSAADVLLMPYQKEVSGSSGGDISRYFSPMKLFEYMATGRAIISSDLPVLREVLNEKNAILVQADDINGWKKAISRVVENLEGVIEIGDQVKRDVQQYSWKNRAAKIIEVAG